MSNTFRTVAPAAAPHPPISHSRGRTKFPIFVIFCAAVDESISDETDALTEFDAFGGISSYLTPFTEVEFVKSSEKLIVHVEYSLSVFNPDL